MYLITQSADSLVQTLPILELFKMYKYVPI